MTREYADGMLDVVVSVRVDAAPRICEGLNASATNLRQQARTAPEPAAQILRDQARAMEYAATQIGTAHRQRMELFKARPDLAPKRKEA